MPSGVWDHPPRQTASSVLGHDGICGAHSKTAHGTLSAYPQTSCAVAPADSAARPVSSCATNRGTPRLTTTTARSAGSSGRSIPTIPPSHSEARHPIGTWLTIRALVHVGDRSAERDRAALQVHCIRWHRDLCPGPGFAARHRRDGDSLGSRTSQPRARGREPW